MSEKIVLFENRIDCCGCGACANVCPKEAVSMTAGAGGYLYPQIDRDRCVSCGACLKVCPLKKRSAAAKAESDKPHIKIINYGMYNNFGAVIAAVCLEKTVRSIVGDRFAIQTVDYNSYAEHTNSLINFKNELINRIDFLKIILEKLNLKKAESETEGFAERKSTPERTARYRKFRNRFLNYTVSMKNCDLDGLDDNDAALICGSDAIWMPSRIHLNSYRGFYLHFGKRKAKRIAYAASLDSEVNSDLIKRWPAYRRRLKIFDSISVRETENLKFVQSAAAGMEVRHCIDPVFLYRPADFDEMIALSDEPAAEEEYIYAYILMKNDSAYEYVRKLAAEKNLKVYYFADCYTDFGENSVDCFSDGPAEFLQRIKNAKYVVTTSFHCIAFSLIFKKQFLAFDRGNNSIKNPDILRLFEASDRLVRDGQNCDIDKPVDFERVERLVERYRGESTEFLKTALKVTAD